MSQGSTPLSWSVSNIDFPFPHHLSWVAQASRSSLGISSLLVPFGSEATSTTTQIECPFALSSPIRSLGEREEAYISMVSSLAGHSRSGLGLTPHRFNSSVLWAPLGFSPTALLSLRKNIALRSTHKALSTSRLSGCIPKN